MLTAKQAEVLNLIEAAIAEHGRAPSYREIAAQLNVLAVSSIHRSVVALEERGFITRTGPNGAARSIQVLKPQTHLNPEYQRGFQDGFEASGRLTRNLG